MFDWTIMLTSSVTSALVTGVIGVIIKSRLDQRLERERQLFEKVKMKDLANTQKDIEYLKSEVGQLNILKQKNLEYYHSIHQISQNKRIEAIEIAWNEYLDVRKFTAPILNFYSVLIPSEYLEVIDEIETKDSWNLKSLDEGDLPKGLDTLSLMFEIEKQRPFLGELLYYKFRSSTIILMRLRLMFANMKKKRNVYLWNQDELLIDHINLVLSSDALTLDGEKIDFDSPMKLLTTIGIIEFELNNTIDNFISGETSANLSLQRVKKLNQGFQ